MKRLDWCKIQYLLKGETGQATYLNQECNNIDYNFRINFIAIEMFLRCIISN